MNRVAFCIGCNSYDNILDLNGAEKDATDIYSVLTNKDFGNYSHEKSILLLSPTLYEIRKKLDEIIYSDARSDYLTIYLSGHGASKNGSFYFCVRDTSPSKLALSALCLSELFHLINDAEIKNVNLIIDACQASGFIQDLSMLLRPESLGVDRKGSVSILAACSTNQFANETNAGGLATRKLLQYINGELIINKTSPTLSLIDIGQVISETPILDEQQNTIAWGLSLYGDSIFCINQNYERDNSKSLFTKSEELSKVLVEKIEQNSEELWANYLLFPNKVNIEETIKLIREVLEKFGDNEVDLIKFISGLSKSYSSKSEESYDLFTKSNFLSFMSSILLTNISNIADFEDVLKNVNNQCIQSAYIALCEVHEQLNSDKYALLSKSGGFSDLYYLPLRISRLLGWFGAIVIVSTYRDVISNVDMSKMRHLINEILDKYCLSVVSVSDSQSVYIALFLCACKNLGWTDELELTFGLMFNNLLERKAVISSASIQNNRVLEFLLRREEDNFIEEHYCMLANPQELLSVLLIAAQSNELYEIVDPYLIELDHTNFNIFLPNKYSSFGQVVIEDGVNRVYQLGHGIWCIDDLKSEWESDCIPYISNDESLNDTEVKISAILSSLVMPDRVPYFIFSDNK